MNEIEAKSLYRTELHGQKHLSVCQQGGDTLVETNAF